ncbi:hypothetical protein CRG98_029154 [Punica granatum]|uniref:Uncharacterized protein n=1 Tax=Punica granatum TaxID=22663 RepID=A0A2I0J2E4_PUNGR|nr:hypothetical protein CRG98_029154 [Punica granatum]
MARRLNATLGPDRAREILGQAVYLFSIGGNDYIYYFTEFYSEGQIAFQNVGPMGCLPSLEMDYPEYNGSCIPVSRSGEPHATAKMAEITGDLGDMAQEIIPFMSPIGEPYWVACTLDEEPALSLGFCKGKGTLELKAFFVGKEGLFVMVEWDGLN